MPFIVTTWPECLGCLNPATDAHHVAPPLSRLTVATLEQARFHIIENGLPASMTIAKAVKLLDGITEAGGTISLPDGTVIEVEAVE